MTDRLSPSRREVLAGAAGLTALSAAGVAFGQAKKAAPPPLSVNLDQIEKVAVNGRINQGICGCGLRLPFEQKCQLIAKMGVKSIDFVNSPDDWAIMKKYGLTSSLCAGAGGISSGWNRKENHEKLVADMKRNLDKAADGGWPNVITFSGNRGGMSDEEGAKNCIEGLKLVAGYAEEKKVTIVIELLNSKVNHKDYMADHTAWGAQVCKGVGSERVKLLYDIYHMQIQEGDLIRNIKDFKDYIAHYHTAGNPGRNELDENQEIYYPAVMRAILATGYTKFVSHEYGPKGDPIKALIQAVKVCDV